MTQRSPTTRFRLTDVEKSTARDEVRALLYELARNREVVTYTEFCLRLPTVHLHPHSFVFAHLLREVCNDEEAKGSGVLCALVVSKTTGMPGAGYFRRREFEGLEPDDLEGHWRAEMEDVFARWAEKPDDDAVDGQAEGNS